jgi:hypothetical protein
MKQNYPVWENACFFNVTANDTYSYQCDLKRHFNFPHVAKAYSSYPILIFKTRKH